MSTTTDNPRGLPPHHGQVCAPGRAGQAPRRNAFGVLLSLPHRPQGGTPSSPVNSEPARDPAPGRNRRYAGAARLLTGCGRGEPAETRGQGTAGKANPSPPAARPEDPMTTQTTTHDERCPGCDQADGARWVTSTPDTDTWACQHCGTEWTTTVYIPGVA